MKILSTILLLSLPTPALADDAVAVTVVPVVAPSVAVPAPVTPLPGSAQGGPDEAMKNVIYLKDGSGIVIDGVLYKRQNAVAAPSPSNTALQMQAQSLELQRQQLAAQQMQAQQQAAAVKQSRKDQRRLRAVMGQGLLRTLIQKYQDDQQP
jgi:hypothetical protein